jgi:hypothetical protein
MKFDYTIYSILFLALKIYLVLSLKRKFIMLSRKDLVTKLQVLMALTVVFLRLVGILWLLSSITYCSNFQKEKLS